WVIAPRKQGGLESAHMSMSHEYGVLIEDEGIALCGLLIRVDPVGCPQQITINNLPVGRSVEGIRLVKAFQFS
ncbi:thioredoxin-dependent peroxidase, partial [Epithele typhae]|uniref:thioredoxin-dependent peroxidase n=1 Tax=Epithele typhae TaxID=378194 RepID=UPI0020078645